MTTVPNESRVLLNGPQNTYFVALGWLVKFKKCGTERQLRTLAGDEYLGAGENENFVANIKSRTVIPSQRTRTYISFREWITFYFLA